MYEGTSSQLRNKYLGGSLTTSNNRGYQGSNDIDYCVEDLELDSIYKKKAMRLELELTELRKENEQLKQSNQQLKASESLRNARNHSFESEKQLQLQRERDDIMRDVNDLARGNRLLSQENDILSQKYSNLLDVYNKVILNNTSASKLAEVYSNQIEGRTKILKDYTKEKWEEFSDLNQNYENNKRKINEMYATLKGKLMHLQTDSHINYDTKEQWRAYAEDVQEVFDSVFRLSQEQSDLHQKLVINMQSKNREIQQKLEEKNGIFVKNNGNISPQNEFNSRDITQNLLQNSAAVNNLTSIQESKNEEKRQYSALQNPLSIPKKESEQLSQTSKRPKTSSISDPQKKTLKKSTSSVRPLSKISETKPKESPSKQNILSPSKTNLGASKKPSMQKIASTTSITPGDQASKLTKSKIISGNKSANKSTAPKINVLSPPK